MKDIQDYKDFPIFQYWDFNSKQFEPRALNHLSTNLNWSLNRSIKEAKKQKKEDLVDFLVTEIINAAKYGVFGNASFEAYNDDSYGGGKDSIQEQFVCWVLGIEQKDYVRSLAYSEDLYKSKVLRDWVLNSALYKNLLKGRR